MFSNISQQTSAEASPPGTICYDTFRALVFSYLGASGVDPYAAVGMLERLKLDLLDEMSCAEGDVESEPEEDE